LKEKKKKTEEKQEVREIVLLFYFSLILYLTNLVRCDFEKHCIYLSTYQFHF